MYVLFSQHFPFPEMSWMHLKTHYSEINTFFVAFSFLKHTLNQAKSTCVCLEHLWGNTMNLNHTEPHSLNHNWKLKHNYSGEDSADGPCSIEEYCTYLEACEALLCSSTSVNTATPVTSALCNFIWWGRLTLGGLGVLCSITMSDFLVSAGFGLQHESLTGLLVSIQTTSGILIQNTALLACKNKQGHCRCSFWSLFWKSKIVHSDR